MTAARSLVTTMKLSDQYKALLPAILWAFDARLSRSKDSKYDYDAMMPTIVDVYAYL